MAPRTTASALEREGVETIADALRYETGSFARSVRVRPSPDVDIVVKLADGRTLVGEIKAASYAEPSRIAKELPEWTTALKRLRSAVAQEDGETGAFAALVADTVPD